MTLARVSPREGRLPDFCVREERGTSGRMSAGFWLEAGVLELMSLGSPSGSRWTRGRAGGEGEERGVEENTAENGPPPLELLHRQ